MKKKIVWESWNQAEEENLAQIKREEASLGKLLAQSGAELVSADDESTEFISKNTVLTPFGEYDTDSFFRPSKRWSCWIGYTNFRLGEEDYRILNEEIEGIEALIVMGPYTFCIGIAKLFDSKNVKQEVMSRFCN